MTEIDDAQETYSFITGFLHSTFESGVRPKHARRDSGLPKTNGEHRHVPSILTFVDWGNTENGGT